MNLRNKLLFNNSNNKNIIINILGTLFCKGSGVIINLMCIPLYLNYFNNNEILGIWFTIINVLNWLLTFDLGIGNGLRNNLTKAIVENNNIKIKELISSSYILLAGVMIIIGLSFLSISKFINWNTFFNISPALLPNNNLYYCINITIGGILLSFLLRLVIAINYALQRSALNNLINLLSSLITYIYLLSVTPKQSIILNFQNLSIFQIFVVNIPLILATFIAFNHKQLKNARPHIKYFKYKSAKAVLSLGITFLYVQILYMIITVTNEWFISKYYHPSFCVDYQIYHKLFSIFGMLFMLGLTPIWSAITKAYAEQRYLWIIKLNKLLYVLVFFVSILQIAILPIIPWILKTWLGKQTIDFNYFIGSIFVIFSLIYIWNAVQSVMVSGLGKLKLQIYGYSFAAIFKIIAIILFYRYFNWEWVIVATCIGLLPYCIIQPLVLHKELKSLQTYKLNT